MTLARSLVRKKRKNRPLFVTHSNKAKMVGKYLMCLHHNIAEKCSRQVKSHLFRPKLGGIYFGIP